MYIDEDWNKRLEALKTLQGMILGSTWTHELFMPNYLKLYKFINYQYSVLLKLKDLRSAVQKEACKLLSLSAETMQKQFEQAAIKYMSKDSLIGIVNSGNKTLCDNAHICIQNIIDYCPSPYFLSQLLEESQSKSQQVRSRVSQYLVQLLPELNQNQLDKNLPALDSAISKGVQDANPEVRMNFRSVFGIYYKIYPQKAEKIYSNSDSSIKKLLQEEMNGGGVVQQNHNQTMTQSSNKLLSSKSQDTIVFNQTQPSGNISKHLKQQQTVQISVNEDNHFVFTSPNSNNQTKQNSQAPPITNLNKTSTQLQKVNDSTPKKITQSTSSNKLNKSVHLIEKVQQEQKISYSSNKISDNLELQNNNKDKSLGTNSKFQVGNNQDDGQMVQNKSQKVQLNQLASQNYDNTQVIQNKTQKSQLAKLGSQNYDDVQTIQNKTQKAQLTQLASLENIKPIYQQPQSVKNSDQGVSYITVNFTNSGQTDYTLDLLKHKQQISSTNILANDQRQNNHQVIQDNKIQSSSNNTSSKLQFESTDTLDVSNFSKKEVVHKSQDPKKNNIESQQQSKTIKEREVFSSNKLSTKSVDAKQFNLIRNTKTEENQNSSDSRFDFEYDNKDKKLQQNQTTQNKQNKNTEKGGLKNNFSQQNIKQKPQYREEENYIYKNNGDNKKNSKRNYTNEEEQEYLDHENEEDVYSNTKSAINKNESSTKQRRLNYSSANFKNDYDDIQQQNLSYYENGSRPNQKKSQTYIKPNYYGINNQEDLIDQQVPSKQNTKLQQNNRNKTPTDGVKRMAKSVSSINQLINSDQKNAVNQQKNQYYASPISQNIQNSKSVQLLNDNLLIKHNNYMGLNEVEDRQLKVNTTTPLDEEQQNRYSNTTKSKSKQLTKSSNNLSKVVSNVSKPQIKEQELNKSAQQFSTNNCKDEDLELILEKINPQTNWSTLVTSFESIKELFGQLNNKNIQDYGKKQNENEQINAQLMKRIINIHIEYLSDSHFKVVSSCLDSLITLVSYDSSYLQLNIDQLIFKVLNNLIDSKDIVSSKANFLINILSKIFPGERLIDPIQKVLEQKVKNLLKICSLEVLMVNVKNSSEYYQSISNVRHTVQLMCMLISENQNQKQITLPCLGIILALRDHNQQLTLQSILSLTNQNQVAILRNLSSEHAKDLEEDLKSFSSKENIKTNDKLVKSNTKLMQIDQNPSSLINSQTSQLQQSTGPSSTKSMSQSNILNGNPHHQKGLSTSTQNLQKMQPVQQINQVQMGKTLQTSKTIAPTSDSNKKVQQQTSQSYDIQKIDEIFQCVKDFEQNESFIIQSINEILSNTIEFFKQSNRKIKEQSLKILKTLFMRNYYYLTIQPHTVIQCLNIYPYIHKDMDFDEVDDVISEMIDCMHHLIFMKALVEKLNSEKPPQLQVMIKKISYILKKARKEEIRPFLDHIIDRFKISINDENPDVRKSVVFCLVDLKFLMQDEINPYLHQFTGNQQKLVDIYIKKRLSNDSNNTQS